MGSSRSSAHLDVEPGERRSSHNVDDDRPFRILLLGDFSGRANRNISTPLSGRMPVMVDRDNADEVLASTGAELELPGLTLRFAEIDDFHPDHIYRNAAVFQRFADERIRPVAKPADAPVVEPRLPGDAGSSLLEQMIDETSEAPSETPEHTGDLADFLKKVVRPHLVAREDPSQQQHAATVDSVAAAAMRGVLHHLDFQALEAAWRAVWMLTLGLDTDGNLKIHIFDATLEELKTDPTGTAKLFNNRERPWSVIAANYVFGQTPKDAKLLSWFGRLASAAGAPFLAEALPPSEAEAGPEWATLRRSPEGRWIGLTLPRFLLRLPYGRQTSPVESFQFDEMPKSKHQEYLWGNPAFCCAYLLGQAFLEDGWDMRSGSHRRMSALPLHVYNEKGESHVKPCAEILMTEKEADFLTDRGFMPLASIKDQDAVLLVRFQSIAEPVAALSGPWVS